MGASSRDPGRGADSLPVSSVDPPASESPSQQEPRPAGRRVPRWRTVRDTLGTWSENAAGVVVRWLADALGPPADRVRRFLRTHWWLPIGWVLLDLAAMQIMRAASTLLATVQTETSASYRAGALTAFPWPPADDADFVAAFQAWAKAGQSAGLVPLVRDLLLTHQLLDLLVFIPALTLVLGWMLWHTAPDELRMKLMALPVCYAIADAGETIGTLCVAAQLQTPKAGDRPLSQEFHASYVTSTIAIFSFIKWAFLIAAAVTILLSVLRRGHHEPDEQRAESGEGEAPAPGTPDPTFRGKHWPRLIWRVRVQVGAVGLLALLFALPLGGPLEQIPDLIRSANDHAWHSREFFGPLLLILVLGVCVWATGQLILLDQASVHAREPTWQPTPGRRAGDVDPLWPLFLVGTGLLALGWVLHRIDGLHASAGTYAAGLAVLGWFLLDCLAQFIAKQALYPDDALPRDLPSTELSVADRTRLGQLIDLLAVAPLTFSALAVVRAYAPPVLVAMGGSSPGLKGARGWLAFGVGLTLASLLAWVGVHRVRRGRLASSWLAAIAIVAVVGGAAVLAACWVTYAPDDAARALQGHGVVILWLVLAVAIAGVLQWVGEDWNIGRLPTGLGMVRTPFILLLVLTALLAGSLDSDVGYHSPRTPFLHPRAPQPVAAAFTDWLSAASQCRPPPEGTPAAAGGDAQRAARTRLPLLLVAAPGGGARAAYWTTLVMRGIAKEDPCFGSSIFAASGVSGGSVGLALWAVSGTAAAGNALELTGPDPLSTNVAAMLFRDMPRALTGLHWYGKDRAAAEEDDWIRKVHALSTDFTRHGGLRGGNAPAKDGDPQWQTHLLFNGSDLSTGCKVLLSTLAVAPEAAKETTDCRATPARGTQAASPALPAGALDARLFMARPDCDGDDTRSVTMAAAALLSARFPFVSPTGQMPRCATREPGPDSSGGTSPGTNPQPGPGSAGAASPADADAVGPPSDRMYVGDGGYLENSGLHTLLALWADLRELVEIENRTNSSYRVVPYLVLVDNHFHSGAAQTPRPKLNELSAPLHASQKALIGQQALEQAARAVFTGPVPGTSSSGSGTSRWLVLAPRERPQVAAPLGWSLSKSARKSLECQIDTRLLDEPPTECPSSASSKAAAAVKDELDAFLAFLNGAAP